MTIINRNIIALSLALTMILSASVAHAALYGFEVVQGSFDTANYLVSVDSLNSGNSVAFTFTNTAQDQSAFTSLYWDFGNNTASFTTPASWIESAGVDYTKNGSTLAANPSSLPGGSTVNFYSDFGMNPDNAGGSIHNGIGSGQSLTVVFDLQNGADYNWVVTAMNADALRVGAHIQGLGEGGELSATGVTTSVTPIPAAVWLFGSGLVGLVGLRRRNIA